MFSKIRSINSVAKKGFYNIIRRDDDSCSVHHHDACIRLISPTISHVAVQLDGQSGFQLYKTPIVLTLQGEFEDEDFNQILPKGIDFQSRVYPVTGDRDNSDGSRISYVDDDENESQEVTLEVLLASGELTLDDIDDISDPTDAIDDDIDDNDYIDDYENDDRDDRDNTSSTGKLISSAAADNNRPDITIMRAKNPDMTIMKNYHLVKMLEVSCGCDIYVCVCLCYVSYLCQH